MPENGEMTTREQYRELDRAAEAAVKAPESERRLAMSRLFALVREFAHQEQRARSYRYARR